MNPARLAVFRHLERKAAAAGEPKPDPAEIARKIMARDREILRELAKS